MQTQTHDPESFLKTDEEFHFLIARATKNQILMQMMEILRGSFSVGSNVRHRPDYIQKVQYVHEEIAKAIARHQPTKASRLMREHLHFTELEFKRRLRN